MCVIVTVALFTVSRPSPSSVAIHRQVRKFRTPINTSAVRCFQVYQALTLSQSVRHFLLPQDCPRQKKTMALGM